MIASWVTLVANLDDWINFCIVVLTECLVCGMFRLYWILLDCSV